MANAWIVKPLPSTVIQASATSIGTPANVLNDYAGVVWGANAASAVGTGPYVHFLQIDLGAAVAIDTVAVFGLPTNISGVTFYVDVSNSPSSAAIAQSDVVSAYAGAAFGTSGSGAGLLSLPQQGSLIPARYLRLIWQSPTRFDLTVSRIVIGKRIQLERNFSYGAAFGVRDLGSLDFSARGVLLRRRAKKLRTIGLTFSSVRKAEVEEITLPLLEQVGNTEMIALVTDPAPDALRQKRMYFGALVGDLSHTWRNAVAFEAKTNLVSIF